MSAGLKQVNVRCWLCAVILVAAFAVPAHSQQKNNKADLLASLTRAPMSGLASAAEKLCSQNPKEAGELMLDLSMYRWAASKSSLSLDITNADQIIDALGKSLHDDTLSWAAKYYSVRQQRTFLPQLPEKDDPRVERIRELGTQFTDALDYRDSSPVESVNAFDSARGMCDQLNLDITQALIYKEQGDQYFYNMSNYARAQTCYDSASWTFSAYGCVASSATLFDDWGTLNTEMGRYRDAVDQYTQAARQWVALADGDVSGYKYRDKAGQAFVRAADAQMAAGDPEKAMDLLNNYALKQIRTYGQMTKSYSQWIETLVYVAQFRRERGENDKALALLETAGTVAERQDNPILRASVLSQLSKVYKTTGDKKQAAADSKRTDILTRTGSNGDSAVSKLSQNLLIPNDRLNELLARALQGARAYEFLSKPTPAAELWQKLADIYRTLGVAEQRVRCLQSLASVYDTLGRPADASAARKDAVSAALQGGNKALATEVNQEIVQSYLDSDDKPNAISALSDLVLLADGRRNARVAAKAMEQRGSLYLQSGDFANAVKDLQQARARYDGTVGDRFAAGAVSIRLAQAQDGLGKPEESRNTLETAFEGLESSYQPDALQRTDVPMQVCEALLRSYIKSEDTDKAEKLAVRAARFPWFVGLLTRLRSDPDDKVRAFAQRDFVPIAEPPVAPELRVKQLAKTWSEFVLTCWKLRERYQSDYDSLPVNPLELCDARKGIPEDSAVIEFMQTEGSVITFVCSGGNPVIKEYTLPAGTLGSSVQRLRRALRSCEELLDAGVPVAPVNSFQEPQFLEVRLPLRELYMSLLSPIEEDFKGRKRLHFALGQLEGLPVHAFISRNSESRPRFLIEDYEVSYLGAGQLGSVFTGAGRAIKPDTDSLAIFADPLGNLPGSRTEAAAIKAAYTNNRSYVGAQADKKSFMSECAKARILHLSAHNSTDRANSGFTLALAPGASGNGVVSLEDMLSVTDPDLQLVTLTACDTISTSDPMSTGTARAAEVFSLIGAQAVLGSLWKVSDEAAGELMRAFYRNLSQGVSRSESIRRAQTSVIQSSSKFAHPFYWACMALYGNPK